MKNKNGITPRAMVIAALMAALACLLMMWDFPLPFAPSFYKVDLSEIPVLIGGFTLGPGYAALIEGLKVLLRLLFKPTETAYVGELANFLIGIALVVPASWWIYRRKKNLISACLGLGIGTLLMVLAGGLFNYFVLLPAYSVLYKMPMEQIISMGTQLVPWIHDAFTFVLLATTPFNLFKGFLISFLMLLLVPRLNVILRKF